MTKNPKITVLRLSRLIKKFISKEHRLLVWVLRGFGKHRVSVGNAVLGRELYVTLHELSDPCEAHRHSSLMLPGPMCYRKSLMLSSGCMGGYDWDSATLPVTEFGRADTSVWLNHKPSTNNKLPNKVPRSLSMATYAAQFQGYSRVFCLVFGLEYAHLDRYSENCSRS